ncbi:response regulator transcription factor [Pedobacter sp.]
MQEALLTSREIELLALIANGLENKSIAKELGISPFTVKRHIENIYKKLQAKNRVHLVMLFNEIGKSD